MPVQVYNNSKGSKSNTATVIILTAFVVMLILTAFLVYKSKEISKSLQPSQPV